MFQSHARNKLSMTLDLRRPDGLEILWDLARTADVLIENNAKETMDGLGVTYDAVRRVRPDIIMIRMPGYGLTGEYEEWRAFGPQMEAVAGHTSLWGYTDLDTSNRQQHLRGRRGVGHDGGGGGAHGPPPRPPAHRRRPVHRSSTRPRTSPPSWAKPSPTTP